MLAITSNWLAPLCAILVLLGCSESRVPASGQEEPDPGSRPAPVPEEEGRKRSRYKVFALNRRGMAFPDRDFSVFAIFPPANFLKAQVIKISIDKNQMPVVLDNAGIGVQYLAIPDANGSINSTSIGKTNFWEYATLLYSFILPLQADIPADVGIFGRVTGRQRMPGETNEPQPFTLFDETAREFTAPWLPVTPLDDNGVINHFPMFRITAVDKTNGAIVGSTDIVLPVAQPMNCTQCHATDEMAADTATNERFHGLLNWSRDPDRERQAKENIVTLHEALNGSLVASRLPLMCAECHYSPVADPDGLGPVSLHQTRRNPLSISIHASHGLTREITLPSADEPPILAENGNESCMICHGRQAPYVRDAMNGEGLVCQDCHGGMLAVGKSPLTGASTARIPFLDEPRCESCHTGDALDYQGDALILSKAYDENDPYATPRVARNRRYAEQPGKLYRQSVGHGGVGCQSCHGSPHAIWSSSVPEMKDNIIPTQLQGHAGTVIECNACHEGGVKLSLGGPHGLHNINDPDWLRNHDGFYRQNPAGCQACHGLNLGGTHLSRALTARIYTVANGPVRYAVGDSVGCGDCHAKP